MVLISLWCSNPAALSSAINFWVWSWVRLRAMQLFSVEFNAGLGALLFRTQSSSSSENAIMGLRRLSETRLTGSPRRSHLRALLGVRCRHAAISFHPFRIAIASLARCYWAAEACPILSLYSLSPDWLGWRNYCEPVPSVRAAPRYVAKDPILFDSGVKRSRPTNRVETFYAQ